MTYLVLGSNSFAGSVFVNYLLTQAEKVIGVSRSVEPSPIMQPYFNHTNKKAFQFYQLNLNEDLSTLFQLIKKHKFSYIVDFAGQGMVAESWEDPALWYTTNITSKVKLHHFLKDCDFLKRYIRISTPEIYGHVAGELTEAQVYNPSTPYAVSHAAIDMSLMAFYRQYQFPVTLCRFANFYGPHQQLYRIIPRTIIYALLSKKLQLHGGGTSQRMFIYGEDVAEGIFRTIQYGQVGEVYHFSNSPCVSILELVQMICKLMGLAPESLIEVAPERAGKDGKYEMKMEKTQQELNWKPTWSLENGLIKTINWVKNNLPSIQQLPLNYIHKT